MKVKIGKYIYEVSTRKDKKLMVLVDKKRIHFGNPNMEHYYDKTRIWKELDHLDSIRKQNYLSRSGGITNKEGKKTKDDPTYSNYHARRILWDA